MKNSDPITQEEFGTNIEGHIVRVYGGLGGLATTQEEATAIIMKCLDFYKNSPTWGSVHAATKYLLTITIKKG